MTKCPCGECILLAMCNSRKSKNIGVFIIDAVFMHECTLIYKYIREEADPKKGLDQVMNEPIELESVKEIAKVFKYKLKRICK